MSERAYRTRLAPFEWTFAVLLAEARNAFSTSLGTAPAHGAPANNGDIDPVVPNVIGAIGEVAVAKLLGLYPNFSSSYEEKATGGFDLAHRINVRSARKRFGLLVRPNDPPEGRYVAAVVSHVDVVILGWETGEKAACDEWLAAPNGRPPCYLVPERELRPVEELISLVGIERAALSNEPMPT